MVTSTLEAIAYQTVDILSLMRRDASGMMIDGGMACNDLLCQVLSDFTGIEIIRPQSIEATALGAAMIAGNTLGLWDIRDLAGSTYSIPLDPMEKLAAQLEARAPSSGVLKSPTSQSMRDRTSSGSEDIRSRTSSGTGRPVLSKRESIMNFFRAPNKTDSLMRTISLSMKKEEPKYPPNSEVFRTTVKDETRAEMINCWRLAIERCMKWTKIKNLEEKRVDYRRRSTIPVGFYLITSFGILMLSNWFSPGGVAAS